MILLSILHEAHQIQKCVEMLFNKRRIVENKLQYARALQLFRRVLVSTREELEDIYTQYVLKSQYQVVSPALCCLYLLKDHVKNNTCS
jgi:outer membrane phospholipase A